MASGALLCPSAREDNTWAGRPHDPKGPLRQVLFPAQPCMVAAGRGRARFMAGGLWPGAAGCSERASGRGPLSVLDTSPSSTLGAVTCQGRASSRLKPQRSAAFR